MPQAIRPEPCSISPRIASAGPPDLTCWVGLRRLRSRSSGRPAG